MAKKKATPIPPTEAPTPDCPKVEEYECPLIVKKQAKRLLGLFNLPEDYPGRNESILKYQESLREKGVENPPINKQDAEEFYKLTGEFHG
jgi:hypothetical protein